MISSTARAPVAGFIQPISYCALRRGIRPNLTRSAKSCAKLFSLHYGILVGRGNRTKQSPAARRFDLLPPRSIPNPSPASMSASDIGFNRSTHHPARNSDPGPSLTLNRVVSRQGRKIRHRDARQWRCSGILAETPDEPLHGHFQPSPLGIRYRDGPGSCIEFA